MPERRPLLEIVQPTGDCFVDEVRPVFEWRLTAEARRALPRLRGRRPPTFQVKVIEAKPGVDLARAFAKRGPVFMGEVTGGLRLAVPRTVQALERGRGYAWQVSAVDGRGEVLAASPIGVFYVERDDLPFRMADLVCCSDMAGQEPGEWDVAYGSPDLQTGVDGCQTAKGAVRLSGTAKKGDAVTQILAEGGIVAGRHYVVSFCARNVPGTLDYVRFRVMAHRKPLPDTGHHPQAGPGIAYVGETGRVAGKEWTRYVLPAWKAPRSFKRLAIAAVVDVRRSRGTGVGEISDVCIREATGCEGGVVLGGEDPLGLPEALRKLQADGSRVTATTVGYDAGSLVDMYGDPFDVDGNPNWYEPGDGCVSIGGWVPDLEDLVPKEFLDGYVAPGFTKEDVDKLTEAIVTTLDEPVPPLPPVDYREPEYCRPPELDKARPFAGRDIIFVHGFRPFDVIHRIVLADPTGTTLAPRYAQVAAAGNLPPVDPRVTQDWPAVPDAYFAGGHFHTEGAAYWRHHIADHLGSPPSNRYVTLAYNSSQRLEVAVHTVLSQLSRAVTEGDGVVWSDEHHPEGAECFGRRAVVITHSTGALVVAVALSIAARTAIDDELREQWGDLASLVAGIDVHISLHGAIAGSDLAAAAVVGANALALAAPVVNAYEDAVLVPLAGAAALLANGLLNGRVSPTALHAFFDSLTDEAGILGAAAAPVVNASILWDLSPPVAKLKWGPHIDAGRIPALTVAGAHPDNMIIAKPVLTGLDDGVVNTNSQSASGSFLHPDMYVHTGAGRVFDMGVPLARAAIFFAEQIRPLGLAAYGSIPWLSPTGMVQPVLASLPAARYRNHFTFLQATSDHGFPATDDANQNEYHDSFGSLNNYEESLVLSSRVPLDAGLVDPAIVARMTRFVRGVDVAMVLVVPVPRVQLWPPRFWFEEMEIRVTFTVWRRFYDLLTHPGVTVSQSATITASSITDLVTLGPDEIDAALADQNEEVDYVYRFVLTTP